MDVSIIIPCYNQERFITDAVNSVFNQETDLSFEIIVVNDCSTDNSVKVIEEHYNNDDNLFLINLDKNSKLPAVRNRGIEKSQGKYIICLDGDDAIPENYIQENYNNLVNNNVDISYSPSQCFGANGKRYNWIDFNLQILRANNYIHASAMFKREIWDKVNGYDEHLTLGWEDYSFWLKAAKLGYSFKRCLSTHLYWRQHNDPTQMTQSVTKNKEETIKQQLKKLHGDFYLGL
jgi:glycosyltransferase involved in cell wall biosynthesis